MHRARDEYFDQAEQHRTDSGQDIGVVWPVNIAMTQPASQDRAMTATVVSRCLIAVSRMEGMPPARALLDTPQG